MKTSADKIKQLETAATHPYSYQYLLLVSAGDLSFVKKMTVMFMESLQRYLEATVQMEADQDLTTLKQATHKVSSSFTSLGMDFLAPDFKQIETTTSWNEATVKSLHHLTATIQQTIPRIQQDMKNEIFGDIPDTEA